MNLLKRRLSDYRNKVMNKNLSFSTRALFPALITVFLFFAAPTFAQTNEPDPQVLQEITAYVRKLETNADANRMAAFTNLIVSQGEAGIYKPEKIVSSFATSEEIKAFEIINRKRFENGMPPLEWNDELARVARLHSSDMAQNKFFSHKGANGSLVNERADSLGVKYWLSIGENIAFNKGFKLPVESACQQWMNSASHRQNLLNKKWKESAIGMSVAPDGSYYFTQVFIVR